MATRRRDMDSSDLRARLGIQEAPEPEAAPEEVVQALPLPESAPSDEPVAGGAPPVASVDDYAHEDYADAVADADDAPVKAVDDWRDDVAIEAPASKNAILIAGAAIGALVFGLAVGIFAGKVSEANNAINVQTEQGARILEPIEAASAKLAALKNELDTMNLERYSAEIDERLAADFGPGTTLGLSSGDVNGARMLLADADAGPAVIDLVTGLQTLDALVKRHLALTARDMPDIQRVLAGTTDEANYAVIFDVHESQRRYGEHMDNPTDSGFMPVNGIRVTLPDNLDVVEQTQRGNTDYFYELRLPNGQNSMIPIYAVISLQRDQLVEGASTETAVTRYVSRVAQIKEVVEATVSTSERAQRNVESVASRGKRFGI